MHYEYDVDKENSGTRIDVVLSLILPETSRSFIQKLIESGNVNIDGAPCTSKNKKLKENQKIEVTIPEPQALEVESEDIPLDIAYEDEQLLVVNKPKGMVVHPAAGNYTGTLVNAVMHHCGDSLSSINGVIRPGIVHRIDKDTSGLLMVAKTDKAHNSLAQQLAEHSITRGYKAIVYNNFSEDEGTIDAPIGRDSNNRLRRCVTDSNSKQAVTHYNVIRRFGKFTLIEARLETGRTHQIRVHMAYRKHPLLGDELYGPAKNPFGVKGQMLHAYLLGFTHPVTGERLTFTAPFPDEFNNVLAKLDMGRHV